MWLSFLVDDRQPTTYITTLETKETPLDWGGKRREWESQSRKVE